MWRGDNRSMKPFKIIVATDLSGGFAKDGKIPWYFKDDFRHFKEITSGHICVMGRLTYEDIMSRRGSIDTSMPVAPVLVNRESYVITSSKDPVYGATTIKTLFDLDKLLDYDEPRDIFIIGGERLFIQALSATNDVHMTIINNRYDCDKRFPVEYVADKFAIAKVYDINGDVKEKTKQPLIFIDWKRIKS